MVQAANLNRTYNVRTLYVHECEPKLYVQCTYIVRTVPAGLEGVDEGPDRTSICSLAQDIVYTASNKWKLTPKQIGLGLTLHQATRSATLVDLFHSAGHTVGMDTIRRLDTTIATKILDKYEQNGNVYIPNDIVQSAKGQMVLASCDNIDVLEETIDGKNTFHSTQMMLWQRGPPPESSSASDQVIGRQKALNPSVLKSLHKLDRATPFSGTRPKPRLDSPAIEIDTWFQSSEERNEAGSKNLAWILSRLHDVDNQHVPSWSSFNEASSTTDPPLTVAGMMPILQAPADDNDTMTTVINRFKKIADHLGQKHTVIVVDQPLYSRAKELIWASPDALLDVVMLLGDLHICFNFLKVIGKHVESAGLDDAWVEAGLFAQNSTEAMMDGKAYYRAVRGHTLAYEALWRIKWEKFQEWLVLNNHNLDLDEEISRVAILFNRKETGYSSDITDAVHGLSSILRNGRVRHLLDAFDKELSQQPTFKFWSTYLEMVELLLDFIRANRDGNWQLHLDTFAAMLPWMTVYDHVNYARWGPVYLADMKALPHTAPEVYQEFLMGNFVVKRSRHRFNQVPVDQATEWINRLCKISNGIIGITRNESARDRFCATWAERSRVSQNTKKLYGLNDDDEAISTRKDALPSHVRSDEESVKKLASEFMRCDVFGAKLAASQAKDPIDMIDEESDEVPEGVLISLASKDVATSEIKDDLFSARSRGAVLVKRNVTERLVEKKVKFFDPVKRNNSKTFATLYKTRVVTQKSENKTVKADRKLIQKLLNASQAGRNIEMERILSHELSILPLSLVKTNGQMNTTSKSEMLELLTKELGKMVPSETPH